MKKKIPGYLIVFVLLFTLVQCAKKGMPEGGPVDEDPPKFIRANPENFTTHFDAKEIRIYFDEYIKLDKPQQQIIISPPMQPRPNIMPLGTARKDVKIEISDTLSENTTYTVNFGKSIVDNNESNPYNYFKYVFSTGDYIDSLAVSGSVKDARLKEPSAAISVFLYEVDSTYSDSAVFKKTPRYVTYSQDSTFIFALENLKAGTYKMAAVLDKNNNYLYNPKTEKIGFISKDIVIPTDSTYNITVFKEELAFNPARPSQVKGNQILFGYEGIPDMDSLSINLLNPFPDGYKSRIVKVPEKDSLHYWYNIKPESDSLSFEIVTPQLRDTLIARISAQDRDSLKVSTEPGGTIGVTQDFKFKANTPITEYSEEQIKIINKDSVEIPFTTEFNPLLNEVVLKFEKQPENKYSISAFPGAIRDLFEATNDTIKQSLSTKSLADFGTISLTIADVESFPIIVQLTTTKGEILQEQYAEGNETFTFKYINPGNILIRVIFDTNKNRKWDTGDFLKKRQPEQIKYFSDTLSIRPNFDYNESIRLD